MFLASSCSCLCPIHWNQVLSWEWRCNWSSSDRRCSKYILVIKNFISYWGATNIRGLTVLWYDVTTLEYMSFSKIFEDYISWSDVDSIVCFVHILPPKMDGWHCNYDIAVLKTVATFHPRNLWTLARSCTKLRLLCPPVIWNLPGTASLSGFQSSWGALKSTE